MKKKSLIIFLMLMVTITISGCVENESGIKESDCPCPKNDSDPSGGSLSPSNSIIGLLQFIRVEHSKYVDFTNIVKEYGGVQGTDEDRTACINITLYNDDKYNEIEVAVSLRNTALSWGYDGLFMESTIWVEHQGVTMYLYTHRSWMVDSWRCSTYKYDDYIIRIPPKNNTTLNLCYMLDSQLSGAFMDGQIFGEGYPVFGIYVGENHGIWEYFPIEVRT